MFDVRLSSKAINVVGLCQGFRGSQAAGLFSDSFRARCGWYSKLIVHDNPARAVSEFV